MTQEKVSSCFTECHAPETFASPLTCAPQQRNDEIDHVAVVPLFWFFGTPRKLFLGGVGSAHVLDNTRKQCISRTLMQCSPFGFFSSPRNGDAEEWRWGPFLLPLLPPCCFTLRWTRRAACTEWRLFLIVHEMRTLRKSTIKQKDHFRLAFLSCTHAKPKRKCYTNPIASAFMRLRLRQTSHRSLSALTESMSSPFNERPKPCTLDHFTSGRTHVSAYCTALRKEGTLSRQCPSKGTDTERQR